MHWIYLIIALVLMLAAVKAAGWLVVVLLLASLAGFIAWMLGWVNSRISSGARNDAQIISPEELRRLREQAQARKAAGQSGTTPPTDGESSP
jgi:hypothetical protein